MSDGVAKCYVFLRFLKHSNLLWLQWKSLRLQWRGPTVWPNATFSCGFYSTQTFLGYNERALGSPRSYRPPPFLSRSGSSYFRAQIHLPKAIASLLLNCFILTLFCPDLDQTIFEPEEPFPKLCQIWSILLHLDTFLSRSGPSHFRARRANPKAHVLFVQNEKNASILSLKLHKIMCFMCSQWKECVYFVIIKLL